MAVSTREAAPGAASAPAFTLDDAELKELFDHARELADLGALARLADWDQNTVLPEGAGAVRGAQLAALEGVLHERSTRPRLGALLAALERRVARAPFTDADRGLVRAVRRDHARAAALPRPLVQRVAEVASSGFHAWVRARRASDFAHFAPSLREMLALQREVAERLVPVVAGAETPYDALLDAYEPGMTERELKPIFARVRELSGDLLGRIRAGGRAVDTRCIEGEFAPERQMALCDRVLRAIGYDFARGQLARSPHPFTSGLAAPFDVRLTVRTAADYLPTSLMAAIHEGGHALYEQGSAPTLARTPLAGGASLGAHESQSRLWENVIGRSVPFWRHHFPIVRQTFRGQFRGVDPAEFARALNHVAPSLIRVEADEVTYNLHIIIRFELESALLAGRLEVERLPEAWNALYREYLGVDPENDAVGVLQDVHWSWGGFGYFPTYSLGNLYAAQIDAALRRAFPDLDRRLAREGSAFLLAWLRERMYAVGAVYETPVLMERLTGERLNVDHFARYLTEKYAWVYELPPRERVPGA